MSSLTNGRRRLGLVLHPLATLCFAVAVVSSVGCSTFKLPGFNTTPVGGSYSTGELGGVDETMDMDVYQKVRQAQAENSIVLQVASDDDEPVRVLPLPPESSGRAVFVSDLLKQTGVMQKLGSVEATLYRSSPQVIGGVRMKVRMSEGRTVVLPESDYSLRPGDRLYVAKSTNTVMDTLLSAALGI